MRRVLVCLSLVSGLLIDAHAARYALLVGNSEAIGRFEPLKYVKNDLSSLREMLAGPCGFPEANMVILYNRTPADLGSALDSFAAKITGASGDLFLFYYSGHAEAACLKMGNAEFPLDSLRQKLAAIPADIRIGIFDACQSGSFTRTKGGKLDQPFMFRENEKTRGQVLLSSSSINENAQESDALKGSVFTFHFVNALRGSADVSGDGRVTLSEAYHYSYHRTIAGTAGTPGGTQHPSYQFRLQGEGDIVLADLNSSSRGLLLGPGVYGAITVINERNSVVADLNKEQNNSVFLALGPGQYRVFAKRSDRQYQARVAISDRRVSRVSPGDFAPISLAQGRGKGYMESLLNAGFSCGFMFTTLGLDRLGEGLAQQFGDYTMLGISPAFPQPQRQSGVIFNIEGLLLQRYRAYCNLTTTHYSTSADYEGKRYNHSDEKRYGVRLSTDYSLLLNVFEFGAGYHFRYAYLNNVAVDAGVVVYGVKMDVRSIVYDSLYNVEGHGYGSDNGYMVLPALSVLYRYPLNRWLDFGAKIRGRYQRHAEPLRRLGTFWSTTSENGDGGTLRYNFQGIDLAFFVTFHLGL